MLDTILISAFLWMAIILAFQVFVRPTPQVWIALALILANAAAWIAIIQYMGGPLL